MMKWVKDSKGVQKQKSVGSFPVSASSVDEIEDKLLAKLTAKEIAQIRDFFGKKDIEEEMIEKEKDVNYVPEQFSKLCKKFKEKPQEELGERDYLDAFGHLAAAFIHDGYGGSILTRIFPKMTDYALFHKLSEEEMKSVIGEWLKLREQFIEQGYTLAWYKQAIGEGK